MDVLLTRATHLAYQPKNQLTDGHRGGASVANGVGPADGTGDTLVLARIGVEGHNNGRSLRVLTARFHAKRAHAHDAQLQPASKARRSAPSAA